MSLVIDSNVWVGFLRSLRSKLSQESFNAWFQPLQFEGLDTSERLLKLRAPSPVIRDWVNTNYSSVVEESFDELKLAGYLIGWTVEEVKALPANVPEKQSSADISARELRSTAEPSFQEGKTSQAAGAATALTQRLSAEPGLNSRYTYDSFVVGSCNQFAHAASAAVAEAPGKTYNPLYIYGGVGL
jgi:chromosomal replication initiator protein